MDFAETIVVELNGYSQLWWQGGNSVEDLTTMIWLTQLKKQQIEPNEKPRCMDLVFTDQPNLVLQSGTRTSLGPYCHRHNNSLSLQLQNTTTF